ncbi:MAG TPA: DUF4190 domain-containing protein [Pyrinomonadaceae bacterium]|jgi:hypothetical protein
MRFCQTDGTPLVGAVGESQAEDPLKTTVVRQEDIAASIPQSDPYKTVVGNSADKDDGDDLLQLPEQEFDPLKTMVATPIGQNKPILEDDSPKFEDIKKEIKSDAPSSPYGGFSQPKDPLPEAPKDYSNDPTLFQPEPPKFNEPNLSPPSFGDLSPKVVKDEEEPPQTVMQNPWDAGSAPKSDESPYINDSPFSKPSDAPSSSPFDAPKPTFDEPKSPFGQPSSFDAPKSPFDPPQTPYETPQTSFDPPKPTFEEPANQFGSAASQFDQMNQGFGTNQPLQQNEWAPPPSPEQGWGDQGLGANTPFQPPPAAVSGVNQTLPIVSLVFGILSVCCYVSPITGLVALITGFLGMKNANNAPNQYGGKTLAIVGMILGGLFFLVGVGYYILVFVIGMGGMLAR